MEMNQDEMEARLLKRMEEQQKLSTRGLNEFFPYYSLGEKDKQFKFKPTKEGLELGFDIVPFLIGSKYPTEKYGNDQEGKETYILDVWVHFNVGSKKAGVVCPLMNYGKPCPLCEERERLLAEAGQLDKDAYKKFKAAHSEVFPKRRVMYNIIARHDEKEEAKGIQILEQSYFFFEKKFLAAAKLPRGGGYIPFPSIKQGKTVWMTIGLTGDDNWDVSPPKFTDRDYKLTMEEVRKATKLDELLNLLNYDEINDLINSSPVEEQDEEDEFPYEQNVKNVEPKREEVKEENVKENVAEAPKKKKEKRSVKPEIVCPVDAVFGKDFDEYTACDACEVRNECRAANINNNVPF